MEKKKKRYKDVLQHVTLVPFWLINQWWWGFSSFKPCRTDVGWNQNVRKVAHTSIKQFSGVSSSMVKTSACYGKMMTSVSHSHPSHKARIRWWWVILVTLVPLCLSPAAQTYKKLCIYFNISVTAYTFCSNLRNITVTVSHKCMVHWTWN